MRFEVTATPDNGRGVNGAFTVYDTNPQAAKSSTYRATNKGKDKVASSWHRTEKAAQAKADKLNGRK